MVGNHHRLGLLFLVPQRPFNRPGPPNQENDAQGYVTYRNRFYRPSSIVWTCNAREISRMEISISARTSNKLKHEGDRSQGIGHGSEQGGQVVGELSATRIAWRTRMKSTKVPNISKNQRKKSFLQVLRPDVASLWFQ